MTIVVTGGSGFIGSALIGVLLSKGHTVIVIDKYGPTLTHQNLFFIPCDLETATLPFNVLERTDAIIHLAGKHTVSASAESPRAGIDSTTNLIASLEQTTNKPPIFISASSVGFYGAGFERDLDERAAVGTSEMSKMIEAQEAAALRAEQFGCRVVIVRTAPVIGHGGFLAPLARAAKLHIAFRLTKEDFWMPWVHLNDLIRIYVFALETNTLQGIVNAAAPEPIRYSEFMKTFTKVTRSIILPRLPFMRWPYNEAIREIMVSQKILPQRLLDKGFAFAYTNITEAIADAVHRPKK
jgi:uncharacterized protein